MSQHKNLCCNRTGNSTNHVHDSAHCAHDSAHGARTLCVRQVQCCHLTYCTMLCNCLSYSALTSFIVKKKYKNDPPGFGVSHTPPSTQVPRSPVFAPSSISSPSSNIHPMTTHAKAGIFKPKAYTTTKHPLLIIPFPCEPKTVKQALQDPIWLQSMQAEFDALQKTNTWTLVPFDSHNCFYQQMGLSG